MAPCNSSSRAQRGISGCRPAPFVRAGLALIASILLASAAHAADAPRKGGLPKPEVPPKPVEDVERFNTADIMPRAVLRQLYQRELGSRFKPDVEEKLYNAHFTIEKYFATTSSRTRKELVTELETTGIDANLLGRIVRVRMDWPELKGGGVYYVNEQLGPYKVRYFLGVPPKYDRATPWPMVVKLPEPHGFLTKPPPSAEQVATIYEQWAREELALHPDALVLMPLMNLDDFYGPSYAGMNSVMQPVRHAYERVNVHPARVYLIGHSMGGAATWNLALHYPTYFAAINPLAGACTGDWQRVRLMNLRNVLPVVWHDALDPVLKPGHSRSMVKALRTLKLDVDSEETKTGEHAPSAEVVERTYAKTLARTRELYPPEVYLQSNRPDTMFNRNDWVQVWQPLNTGKERRLFLRNGRGNFVITDNAWTAQAARTAPNKVEMIAKNVATLRVYFNDQTAEFREPVRVIVNKKVRFEGALKPSVDEMLKDQLFLGRGWRYYTAAVDIDLAPLPSTQPSTRPAAKPNGKLPLPE